MNLDFGLDPVFSWYVVLLCLSGIVMVALTAIKAGEQSVGSRVLGVVAGLGFLGYGIYLGFIFDGGSYMMFFQAFILPVALIVNFIRSLLAKNAEAQQQPYPGAHAQQYPGAPVQGQQYPGTPAQGQAYSGAPAQGQQYPGAPAQGQPYQGGYAQPQPYTGGPTQPYSAQPYPAQQQPAQPQPEGYPAPTQPGLPQPGPTQPS